MDERICGRLEGLAIKILYQSAIGTFGRIVFPVREVSINVREITSQFNQRRSYIHVIHYIYVPEASFVALISGEPWFGALFGSLSVN